MSRETQNGLIIYKDGVVLRRKNKRIMLKQSAIGVEFVVYGVYKDEGGKVNHQTAAISTYKRGISVNGIHMSNELVLDLLECLHQYHENIGFREIYPEPLENSDTQ